MSSKSSASQSEWIDRFHARLGSLVPSLDVDDAMRRAIDTYLDARDLEPEEAADIYAMELPPLDPDAPGD